MKYFSVSGEWTEPYRTRTCLWEAIENVAICDELEVLDDISDTTIAQLMLTSIGVLCK
jgi:hypothetical protein